MSSYYIETMDAQRQAAGRAFDDLAAEAGSRIQMSVTRVFGVLCRWQQRDMDRTRISQMTWSRLDDIGISAAMAEREAAKPFWAA